MAGPNPEMVGAVQKGGKGRQRKTQVCFIVFELVPPTSIRRGQSQHTAVCQHGRVVAVELIAAQDRGIGEDFQACSQHGELTVFNSEWRISRTGQANETIGKPTGFNQAVRASFRQVEVNGEVGKFAQTKNRPALRGS